MQALLILRRSFNPSKLTSLSLKSATLDRRRQRLARAPFERHAGLSCQGSIIREAAYVFCEPLAMAVVNRIVDRSRKPAALTNRLRSEPPAIQHLRTALRIRRDLDRQYALRSWLSSSAARDDRSLVRAWPRVARARRRALDRAPPPAHVRHACRSELHRRRRRRCASLEHREWRSAVHRRLEHRERIIRTRSRDVAGQRLDPTTPTLYVRAEREPEVAGEMRVAVECGEDRCRTSQRCYGAGVTAVHRWSDAAVSPRACPARIRLEWRSNGSSRELDHAANDPRTRHRCRRRHHRGRRAVGRDDAEGTRAILRRRAPRFEHPARSRRGHGSGALSLAQRRLAQRAGFDTKSWRNRSSRR